MENNEQNGVVETQNNTQPQFDIESEYKKVLAERDSYKAEAEKQKGLKDKYANENASYKKKELDKMSDDEKKAKELQDIMDENKLVKAELQQMKLEKEILASGFTAEECDKLMKGNMAVGVFAEILKARLEENTKSVKASLIKSSTPDAPLGNGSTADPNMSYAEKLAKSRFDTNSASEKIKNIYKR